MARPRVDVGVVTWNTASLTAQALRRLADSDQGCDLRILVHDNASTDGTAEAVGRAVPEAEVTRSGDNLGFARGVNALLARSDAPWFLALNSDAWPEPGAVAHLVATAEAHPDAAAVAPQLRRPDDTLEHSTHPFPSLTLAALDAVGARPLLPRSWAARQCLEGAWAHDEGRYVDWAVGAALLLRRDAVREVGGLDERFFMYIEDIEWCWRARQRGWRIRFEPGAVVRHVGNASGARRFGEARAAMELANLRIFMADAVGPRRAALFHRLQRVAMTQQYLRARARRQHALAARWRTHLDAARGTLAPPVVDGSPGDASPGALSASRAGDGTARTA